MLLGGACKPPFAERRSQFDQKTLQGDVIVDVMPYHDPFAVGHYHPVRVQDGRVAAEVYVRHPGTKAEEKVCFLHDSSDRLVGEGPEVGACVAVQLLGHYRLSRGQSWRPESRCDE